MKKLKIATSVLVIVTLITVAAILVSAHIALTFTQNPSVPEPVVSFTTTPSIEENSDQTTLWTYDPEQKVFTASITLTNTGTIEWTPTITITESPSDWQWQLSTSTLSTIQPNGSLLVNLTLTYTGTGTPNSGEIGLFRIRIA